MCVGINKRNLFWLHTWRSKCGSKDIQSGSATTFRISCPKSGIQSFWNPRWSKTCKNQRLKHPNYIPPGYLIRGVTLVLASLAVRWEVVEGESICICKTVVDGGGVMCWATFDVQGLLVLLTGCWMHPWTSTAMDMTVWVSSWAIYDFHVLVPRWYIVMHFVILPSVIIDYGFTWPSTHDCRVVLSMDEQFMQHTVLYFDDNLQHVCVVKNKAATVQLWCSYWAVCGGCYTTGLAAKYRLFIAIDRICSCIAKIAVKYKLCREEVIAIQDAPILGFINGCFELFLNRPLQICTIYRSLQFCN